MQLNEIYFAGYAGKDAETFDTKNGSIVVSLSICHTDKRRDTGAETTTWAKVKVFGAWTELAKTVQKGDNVVVKGTLSITKFRTKDGKDAWETAINAFSIGVLKREDKKSVGSYVPPAQNYPQGEPQRHEAKGDPYSMEDIPF